MTDAPQKPQPVERLPNLIAGLQLEHYIVDDLTFRCNATVATDKAKTALPDIAIDFDVKTNKKEKDRCLLLMAVDLNKEQDLKEFDLYQIHLHIVGWFRFTPGLDDATKAKMMFSNGSSILYGVARTVVANLTGSVGPQRYILPSLNLLSVIEAKMKKAQTKASKA
jgi:preprotein translocase subunit SecB